MAPRKATSGESGPEAPQGLNTNEMKFIKAVFDNMTQKPDANWDGVAVDLGLKDAKCAKERFRQLSVRHGWREQASAGAGGRRAKPAAANGDSKVTKKSRTPRTPRKKRVMKEETDDEDEKNDVKSEDSDDKDVQDTSNGSI